jgi:hypothetical protein
MEKVEIEFNIPDEELIDEIGQYIGFTMWNNRDKSKEYDFPGSREEHCSHGDKYIEGNIIIFKSTPLLVYKNKNCFHGFKTLYTLNLLTIKPTKNSHIKTILSQELVEKIKTSKKCWSSMSKGVKIKLK